MSSTKPGDKMKAKSGVGATEEDDVELLKCQRSRCKGFLSSGFIKITGDGKFLCTKCPNAENMATLSNEILEYLLARYHFPCKYKEYGCEDKPLYGSVDKHEADCRFKPISCFMLPANSCPWKGQRFEIINHLRQVHAQNVVEKGEFAFGKSTLEENVYVFEQGNVVTIMYYTFDPQKKKLKYCICYISPDNNKIEYVINIKSDKGGCSLLFNYRKHELYRGNWFPHESVLNFQYIQPFVDENAETFQFSVELKVPEDSPRKKIRARRSTTKQEKLTSK